MSDHNLSCQPSTTDRSDAHKLEPVSHPPHVFRQSLLNFTNIRRTKTLKCTNCLFGINQCEGDACQVELILLKCARMLPGQQEAQTYIGMFLDASICMTLFYTPYLRASYRALLVLQAPNHGWKIMSKVGATKVYFGVPTIEYWCGQQ